LGHSDGDVVLHALCDALLGAIAAGDIGVHFPDSDPAFRGIDSGILLQRVAAVLRERGYRPSNVDVTILAERPKLAPLLPVMRERIAALLGIEIDLVSLKAKTMEGLGAIGEGDAIGASVVALVTAA
jgi:2-C-methyl-D-erythritol 2,4-cyclodiphosphate synthase